MEPLRLTPVRIAGEVWDLARYRARLEEEQENALSGLGGEWRVPASLVAKVEPTGRLRAFAGDTIVAPLGPPVRAALARARDRLVEGLEPLFAEPLPAHSFHLTVHDLSNGPDSRELRRSMASNRARVREIFRTVPPGRVRLVPARVYPCLNISVLAGYVPATSDDFHLLFSVHALFDEVVRLDYWLRPHVTLAYFMPRPLAPDEVSRLRERLRGGFELPPLELDLEQVAYQEFSSMAEYRHLFSVGEVR